jgi:hypothetical protein
MKDAKETARAIISKLFPRSKSNLIMNHPAGSYNPRAKTLNSTSQTF